MSTTRTTSTNVVHRRVSAGGRITRSFVEQIGVGFRFVVATARAMRDTKD